MRDKVRMADMNRVLSDVFGVFYTGTHRGEGAANNAATLTDMGDTRKRFPFLDEVVGRTIYNLTDGSSGPITAVTNNTVTATLAGGTDNDWDLNDLYVIGDRVLNVALGGSPVPGASLPPIDGYSTISDGRKTVTVPGTAEPLVGSATPAKRVEIQALFSNTQRIAVGASTVVEAAGSERGYILLPGSNKTLFVEDLADIYIDPNQANEGVAFTAFE